MVRTLFSYPQTYNIDHWKILQHIPAHTADNVNARVVDIHVYNYVVIFRGLSVTDIAPHQIIPVTLTPVSRWVSESNPLQVV